jgi:hypothetical protein
LNEVLVGCILLGAEKDRSLQIGQAENMPLRNDLDKRFAPLLHECLD